MKQIPVESFDVETGIENKNVNAKTRLALTQTYPSAEESEDKRVIEKRLFDAFNDYR